ncbi:lipase member K-like [Daphnia pulicaria]|uniref:lipase member K-like n=1 Tax=Daphnia pulicaria TaxID=35523 RepID=UPI001EECCA9C|nr:lipase member K-like [Daphnia pulicaria]
MILSRRLECFYYLLTLTANILGETSYTTVGHHARGVLKYWRRTAEEQRARLFDLLPKNVESSYTPPEVIKHRGYPAEVHHVTTDDGYILELHRIPPKSSSTNRKVVLLMHGVVESSGTWVVNPSSRSLAILLAAQSYDVWLGNFRGNRYSKSHIRLSPKQAQFWKFSWDEIGNYDIPSFINYILKETGQSKLSYIAHSLGCGVFFIAMVKHPELNAKIDIMIALAPLSSFAHFTTPLFRILTPLSKRIQGILRMTRTWGVLDSAGIPDLLYNIVCDQTYSQARFCRKLLNAIAGPNPDNIELELIPLVGSNYLQGTSVPVMAQFSQNYFAGERFQAYDYGWRGNLMRYRSFKPMEYVLAKVTAPVYLFLGGSDRIVTPLDVDWLLKQLGNLKGSARLNDYNHADFLWGTDVKERLYDKVLSLLPPP